MKRYILHVSEDGRVRLPDEVVEALGKEQKVRLVDMGHYIELTLPNGNPIVTPTSAVSLS